MPAFDTRHFGRIVYRDDVALTFPRGLPGFENYRRFLVLSLPHQEPLVFLQSLEDAALCFLTLPVLAVDCSFRLEISSEDRALIGLPPGLPPRIGEDVLCLAVLSIREEGPTANLLAPLVVNLRNRLSVQAVAAESGYSHQHPLLSATGQAAGEEAVACS
jgi:flagellar assembly factor FliW